MELEHKTFPFAEFKSTTAEDDGNGNLEGYVAVFGNVDLQNDIVEAGAFKNGLSDFLQSGFISWGHDPDIPIATISSAQEDAHGLRISAEYHSTPLAQEKRRIAAERLARGKTMGLSIGYLVNQGGAQRDAKGIRHLSDLKVFEGALTVIPANQQAVLTGAKSRKAVVDENAYQPQAVRVHESMTGTHSHAHSAMGSQGGDQTHTHSHTHQGDANHAHAHKSLALVEQKATWDTSYINSLKDDCFAAIEGGGEKDADGKTTPRSLRHYPHHAQGNGASGTGGTVDESHLRAALSRVGDPNNFQGGKAHLDAHAKKLGIGKDNSGAGKAAELSGRKYMDSMMGSSDSNPFAIALPGSYEAIQEALEDMANEVAPQWAMGPLAAYFDAEDMGMVCACLVTTTDSAATFLLLDYFDMDSMVYVSVDYQMDAGGALTLGEPQPVAPAFVPMRTAPVMGMSSLRVLTLKRLLTPLLAKEGRVLSGGNRQTLADCREAMQKAMSAIDDLLAASEPPPAKDAGRHLYAAHLREKARRMSVAI